MRQTAWRAYRWVQGSEVLLPLRTTNKVNMEQRRNGWLNGWMDQWMDELLNCINEIMKE